jgi:hypothetical protein
VRFKNNIYTNLCDWHPWFAWYPVEVGNEIVWLESVERKMTDCMYGESWEYQYKGEKNV